MLGKKELVDKMKPSIFRTAPLLVVIWLLAACGTAQTPTPGERPTPTPLPTAEGWIEPARAITLQIADDLRELGVLQVPEPPSTVFGYALSPDQTLLAGLNSNWLLVWDLVSGELLYNVPSRAANRVYFSPDKDEIFTVNRDGVIEIFNTTNGSGKDTLTAFPNYSNIAAYNSELGLLVLGATDGTFKVWDLPTRQSILTQSLSAPQEITALAFSQASGHLALGNIEGLVEIWALTGERQSQMETLARVSALLFSPDDRFLVTSSPESSIVWNTGDGSQLYLLNTGGTGDVLAFIPDSYYLLTNTGTPEVLVWDVELGDVIAEIKRTGQDRVSVDTSPDGQMLFLADLGVGASLWSLENVSEGAVGRASLNVPQTTIFNLAWTEDSFQLLLFDTTGPIRVWGIGPE